jgi:hypothetical protein
MPANGCPHHKVPAKGQLNPTSRPLMVGKNILLMCSLNLDILRSATCGVLQFQVNTHQVAHELHKPGRLPIDGSLPQTIRDVMQLVRLVGERTCGFTVSVSLRMMPT